jgi:hypothetical protein
MDRGSSAKWLTRAVAVLTATFYTWWLQGSDWLAQGIIVGVVVGVVLLVIDKTTGLITRGLAKGARWIKGRVRPPPAAPAGPEVKREDRQYLATCAKHGVGLCNKVLRVEDVAGWVGDYENWREAIILRVLQEKFPESDEMEFRNPRNWPLSSSEGLPHINDAPLQAKLRFIRDLNIVGDIIRRHTDRGLDPLWVSPWKV